VAHPTRTSSAQVEPAAPTPAAPGISGGLTLAALAIAGLVASLQQTLVLPLLPALMIHFHASVSAVTWVFTSTLLAGVLARMASWAVRADLRVAVGCEYRPGSHSVAGP